MLFEFRTDRKIIDIPIIKIRPCRFSVREDYPIEKIRELAGSIERNGMIQPVIVRKVTREEYELIAGEMRLRAAALAGMKKIPCIVKKMSDKQAGIDALEENLRRYQISGFEEAEVIYKLLSEYGDELICEDDDKLKLLAFSEEERQIMNKYGFTEGHARALLKIRDCTARKFIIGEIIEEGLNVTQTEGYIEEFLLCRKAERLSRQKNKFVIKNIRIFENTINKAISVMTKTGLRIISEKREGEEYYEYTVRVPKSMLSHVNNEPRSA